MSTATKPLSLEKLIEDYNATAYFDSQVGFARLVQPVPVSGIVTLSAGSASAIVSYDAHVPNAETEAAILEARAGLGLSRTADKDDLFRKLND